MYKFLKNLGQRHSGRVKKMVSSATNLAIKATPVLLLAMVVAPDVVFAAGTAAGTDPFQSMLTTATGWIQGSLGQLVSLTAITYGLGSGLFKNSVGGAVTGVGGGMVMNASPTIVQNTFGAVLASALPVAASTIATTTQHLPLAVQAVIGG